MEPELIHQINQVKRIATSSKAKRLLHNPYKYIFAIGFRTFIYPRGQQERMIETALFFGKKMKIALPAATDIYLTGGKSHPSEINLAKFLILNLSTGDCFLDIGAHFGYFTMLSSHILGDKGRVIALEPAEKSFRLLKENTQNLKNATVFRQAVTDTEGTIAFYEFPNLYSEYNSYDVKQFENEEWFQDARPRKVEVAATTIDSLLKKHSFHPEIIKIDVEGGEYKTILGGLHYLKNYSPKVVMEYLPPERNNDSHQKALQLLKDSGYVAHIIQDDGSLQATADIDQYLSSKKLDSENVVFIKKESL